MFWPCPGRRPSAKPRSERAPDRTPQQQCGDRPYHFVVHGLWPQYERGFPRECQVPAPRLNRNIMSSMLDLMPSPRLVFNEWDEHGTCSGLGPQGYFDAVRKSYDTTKIPDKFLNVTNYLMVTPDEVEEAFVAANPGHVARGDRGHLRHAAAERSAHLHDQGFAVSRLPGGRPPRLPARQDRDAAGPRQRIISRRSCGLTGSNAARKDAAFSVQGRA